MLNKNVVALPTRFVEKYLILIIIYGVIDFVIGGFAVFFDIRTPFILTMLSIRLLLDFLLIVFNFTKIKLSKLEILLIGLLFITLFLGILNFPIGRRHFTDFINPLMFILKISIFRQFLSFQSNIWIKTYIFKFARILFWVGMINVAALYIINYFMPIYLGATPIAYPFLIKAMLGSNIKYSSIAIIGVILAGKRAILLGVIVILVTYYVIIKKKIKSIFYFLIAIFFLSSIYIIFQDNVEETQAINKYKNSFNAISSYDFEYDDLDLLNTISGGRISEIQGAFQDFDSPFEYAFGQGVGFVFRWYLSDNIIIQDNHSNVHFSPAGIISKYGLLFFISLYFYIFLAMIKSRLGWKKSNYLHIFMFLYVIGVLVDSLFAYTLFIDIFLPIALGYLTIYSKKNNLDDYDSVENLK